MVWNFIFCLNININSLTNVITTIKCSRGNCNLEPQIYIYFWVFFNISSQTFLNVKTNQCYLFPLFTILRSKLERKWLERSDHLNCSKSEHFKHMLSTMQIPPFDFCCEVSYWLSKIKKIWYTINTWNQKFHKEI